MKTLSLILFAAVMVILTVTNWVIAVDDSLVLYLPFDDGKGKDAVDSSKYSNDGTLEGGAKWADGKYGKAVAFEQEGDHVKVESSDSLKIENQITLMAWGKIDAWVGGGDQWIGKGAHASKPNCYGMMVYQSANTYLMLGDGAARHDLIIPNTIETGEWHHVAGTYDGKTMLIYVNGEVVGEKEDAFAFNGVNDLPVVIGMGVDRPQYTFEGVIDEAAIFNRALNADEVKSMMNGIGIALGIEPLNKVAATWGSLKNPGKFHNRHYWK